MRIVVHGKPVTEGSVQAFVAGERAIVVQGGSPDRRRRLTDWRQAIADAGRRAIEEDGGELLAGPVNVAVIFGLQAPASTPKRRRTYPIKARSGDVDKLLRAVLDALTGVVWADDSQVVFAWCLKDWTPRPGVVIEISTETTELASAEDYAPELM